VTIVDEHRPGTVLALVPDRSARPALFLRALGRRAAAGTGPHWLILADLGPAEAARCALDRAHHVVEVQSG
jgi:hypothetical protein